MARDPMAFDGLPPGLSNLGEWYISEFTNEQAGLTLRGRFRMSPFQKLDSEQTKFLVTFLRCRGVLSSVEKELGLSYPTVRARLDSLLRALGFASETDADTESYRRASDKRREILEKLEAGEITPEEAKKAIKEIAR